SFSNLVNCTPAKKQNHNSIPDDENDKDLEMRRSRLLHQLRGRDRIVTFDDLLEMTGLEDRYE
ncbi:hypothetical protein J3B02_005486, partial [Coemansia erecta]